MFHARIQSIPPGGPFLSHQHISQRTVRTSLQGPNCFSRWSVAVFLRKPIATSDFPSLNPQMCLIAFALFHSCISPTDRCVLSYFALSSNLLIAYQLYLILKTKLTGGSMGIKHNYYLFSPSTLNRVKSGNFGH